jgi:hypothetical protein
VSAGDGALAETGDLLERHEYALAMKRGSICECGFVPTVEPESLKTLQDYHRAHLAELLRERMAEAWDDGLRFGQQHWATNYAGLYKNGSPLHEAPNPYRVSTPPGTAATDA